jgi:hypothetical protein
MTLWCLLFITSYVFCLRTLDVFVKMIANFVLIYGYFQVDDIIIIWHEIACAGG